MSNTATTTASVREFVARQAALVSGIDREEQAATVVLSLLQSLAVAAWLAVKDGATLATLATANVKALTAQGWNITRTADSDGPNRRAGRMAECLFVSKAAIGYLSATGQILSLPLADDGAVLDSKAMLSLVRRVYKGGKGLGAKAITGAVRTGSQQGAVSYLRSALATAAATAQNVKDAANAESQATAAATLADVIRGAVALIDAGAPIDPAARAALAELRGAFARDGKAAVPAIVAAA